MTPFFYYGVWQMIATGYNRIEIKNIYFKAIFERLYLNLFTIDTIS